MSLNNQDRFLESRQGFSFDSSSGLRTDPNVLPNDTFDHVVDMIIQNQDTAPMFIKFGTATTPPASFTDYDVILKGGAVFQDGTGGVLAIEGISTSQNITAFSSFSLRYSATFR